MVRNFFLYLCLAIFSVVFIAAVGIYLKPGNEEVALMQLKDRRYKEALATYEELKAHGDVSMNVVIPLVRTYELEGDMDNAVTLMEDFVKDHPKSLEARKRLGKLYVDSDRTQQYIESLEIEVAMQPTSENLRELAYRYNFSGDYDKEAQTLVHLIEEEDYTPREEDYYKVASYYTMEHRYDDAAATLNALLKAKQFGVTGGTMDLVLDLLLQTGRTNDALQLATAYANGQKDSHMICHFASLFLKRGQPLFALVLLDTGTDLPDESGELLAERADAEIDSQKQDGQFRSLAQSFNNGSLSHAQMGELADMAIKRRDEGLLKRLLPDYLNADLGDDEQRHIAHSLLDSGFKAEAEPLLMETAAESSPDSPDVEDLLTIWQGKPSETTVEWIRRHASRSSGAEQNKWLSYLDATEPKQSVIDTMVSERGLNGKDTQEYIEALRSPDRLNVLQNLKSRAMHTRGSEQTKWLSYLNESGQKGAIMDVVEKTHDSSQEGVDIYLDAVISSGDKNKLAAVLKQKLVQSTSLAQTKKITAVAVGENLPAVALTGYQTIHAQYPNDADALRFIGLTQFGRGHMSDAEPLLRRYLELSHKSDAEAEYGMGEIMRRKKHTDESLHYYGMALKDITAKAAPTFEDKVMEAHIFYRQGQTDKSLQLFRELLAQKPGDKSLRTDFANILMEAHQYDEANKLLKDE